MKPTIRTLQIIGLVPALFLTGCQLSNPTPNENLSTTGQMGALFFSPAKEPGQTASGNGIVALFNESGEVRMQELGRIERGELAWGDKDVLFYKDNDNDYLMTDQGISKIPTIKDTSYADSIIHLQDDNFLGAYNKGFSEDSYIEPIVIHSSQSSSSNVLNNSIWSLSKCDNDVYAFKYTEEEDKERQTNTDYSLTSIAINGSINFHRSVRHPNTMPKLLLAHGNHPCRDRKVYSINNLYNEDVMPSEQIINTSKSDQFIFDNIEPSIFFKSSENDGTVITSLDIWSLDDQKVTSIPLKQKNGKPFSLTNEQMGNSIVDDESLQNNHIYWIQERSILKTDVQTGLTEEIISGVLPDPTSTIILMEVHSGVMSIAYSPLDNAKSITIKQIELDSGRTLKEISLSANKIDVSKHQLTGFGIKYD